MKLTLTQTELVVALASFYNLSSSGLSVEIVPDPVPVVTPAMENEAAAEKLRFAMFEAGILDGLTQNIRPDRKIAAIKLLRELWNGSGLAEAKAAVESWERFLGFVKKNGVPKLGTQEWMW